MLLTPLTPGLSSFCPLGRSEGLTPCSFLVHVLGVNHVAQVTGFDFANTKSRHETMLGLLNVFLFQA